METSRNKLSPLAPYFPPCSRRLQSQKKIISQTLQNKNNTTYLTPSVFVLKRDIVSKRREFITYEGALYMYVFPSIDFILDDFLKCLLVSLS